MVGAARPDSRQAVEVDVIGMCVITGLIKGERVFMSQEFDLCL